MESTATLAYIDNWQFEYYNAENSYVYFKRKEVDNMKKEHLYTIDRVINIARAIFDALSGIVNVFMTIFEYNRQAA